MDLSSSVVIIGAGPGGYAAAFRAADLGLSVTLIDNRPRLGGVCLNCGCIPSKALLHAAVIVTGAIEAKNIGINLGTPNVDLATLRGWKDSVVTKLTGGLAQLAKARKIVVIQGQAKFLGPTTLTVTKSGGAVDQLTFEHAIIATGSRPVELPFLQKTERIWDSTDALSLPEVPPNLLIIGGGYIGLELGTAYAALGSKVTVVEALPALLSSVDKDLADIVVRRLKKTFKAVLTGTKVVKAEETADGVRVTLADSQGKETTELFDRVLVSVGKKPNTDGLGLETTKVQVDSHGFIDVDERRRTDEKNIFAIGDAAGNPMLAHKATLEGKVAAEAIAGKNTVYEPRTIPAVVFTNPELAWCGLTEAEARARNLDITVSKFPWAASGRALTIDRTDGATKIIADTKTGRILGFGIVGIGAGDLISEGALAIETGLKLEDLALTVHPHPTLSETVLEAAEGALGSAIHIFKPR